jgi:hypothetical protein
MQKTVEKPALHYPKKLMGDGDSNTKLRKNGKDFETLGLSLSPHKSAGLGNLCTHASSGCIASCLNEQGLASVFEAIKEARKRRTEIFYRDRDWFIGRIKTEISNRCKLANKRGTRVAVRLNVFSDVIWEKVAPSLFTDFPDVDFYDYSKHPKRFGAIKPNYWVTFSRSEVNDSDCQRILESGGNVAVVFYNPGSGFVGNRAGLQTLPKTWNGFQVIDGDISDLRFEDTRGRKNGRVVGLRLKAHSTEARAEAIASGFPIQC